MTAKSTGSSARRKQGALIEWHDVSYTVTDQVTKQKKTIISNMYGLAQPGRLLAIMGPSGAGKSTLLDVLACNNSSQGAALSGRITVDGAPRAARQFAFISCYVQQKDVLLSSATVREVIHTAALLKLPYRGMAAAAKRELVEATLKELDLAGCADTLIGDETIGLKGISGGQKRRVSVGIELVKDPRVLFLDEPSSGLDSEMALGVMSSLVRLARKGRTVVCTIHQPNSDITDCFDDYLLLAGGRTLYGGLWSGAVDFFARAGYSCPSFKNPTDYFMSVITRDEAAVDTLATAYAKLRLGLLAEAADEGRATASQLGLSATAADGGWSTYSTAGGGALSATPQSSSRLAEFAATAEAADDGEEMKGGGTAAAVALDVESGSGRGSGGGYADRADVDASGALEEPAGPLVPVWFQVGVLTARVWRTWIRSPVMLASELVQYLFFALFVGLMYFRFNDKLGEGDFNRIACIWFSFAVLCFTPSYTAVTSWAAERLLLKRELDQRLYGINTYYLARYAVLLPFEMAQCALFLCVMYFFVGFYPSAANFFIFFAVLSMFQIISEGLGVCCAVVTKTPTSAVIMLTFVLLVLLSFSGFLTVKTPVYFVWVQKMSFFTYSFSALLDTEFAKISFVGAEGQTVPGMEVLPASVDTGLTTAQNIGVVAAQVGGMELIKLAALHLAYRLKWL
ncbi:hypothetical protein HYH02_003126 [Chlamydomonas schloesseri]|uniref:ABC transporter domain-containing protein n=1 Tax=Chlamydomonas schloesseri TaxID=2026947 RepID=A0A836BAE3_9CHLO|nr:hypothetical protein HYH02_003126 [Chlamydomonas schloesseri]|eukprot:KAG2452090.1 hypothetical protein HYH02_003126 [Chlamydomonas schloesseri]